MAHPRTRWWVTAGTAVVVGLVGVGALGVVRAYGQEAQARRQSVEVSADSAAATVSAWVTGEIAALQAVAASDAVISGDLGAIRAYLQRADPEGSAAGGGFAWVDRQGRMQVLGALPPGRSADLSARQYIQAGLAADGPSIGHAVTSTGSTAIVVVTVPTRDAAGRRTGLVMRATLLSAANPLVAALGTIDDVLLLDAAGQVIVDGGPVAGDRLLRAAPPLRTAIGERGRGLVEVAPEADWLLDGATATKAGRRVVAVAKVPRADWTVVVAPADSEVLGRARRRLAVALSVLMTLGLASALVGAWSVRRLAERGALAEENARLYEREHLLAVNLQRAMLPQRLPEVADLDVAVRYLAADDHLQVGGDWYDVLELPDGRLGVVVGDVVGHNIEAAVTMGRLRTALAALAPGAPDAATAVARLDEFAEHVPGATASTLVYVDLDDTSTRAQLVRAGHLPPVLVTPDGGVSLVEDAGGPPLAVVPGAREQLAVDLPPGALLLLYTDGLVERRDRSLEEGLTRLLDVVGNAVAASGVADLRPESLVASLLAGLGVAHPEDDIALLCLRRRPVGAGVTTPR